MTVPTPTRQRMHRTPRAHAHPLSLIAILTAVVVAASGCASGTDAVASGANFDFVSPGRTNRYFVRPARIAKHESVYWPDLTSWPTVAIFHSLITPVRSS